jgi:hypothetical protein
LPSPSLNDVAAVWRALTEQRPEWAWHVCDDPPLNGRYYVDHAENRLWLPGHLTGSACFRAFMEGGVELLNGDALELPNVIALRPHRAAIGRRGRAG